MRSLLIIFGALSGLMLAVNLCMSSVSRLEMSPTPDHGAFIWHAPFEFTTPEIIDPLRVQETPSGEVLQLSLAGLAEEAAITEISRNDGAAVTVRSEGQLVTIVLPTHAAPRDRALEALMAKVRATEDRVDADQDALERLQAEHVLRERAEHEATIRAVIAETRVLQQQLQKLEFDVTRYEAIRAAEAEAFEIRTDAESRRKMDEVLALRDRLRSEALNRPGAQIYTALVASRVSKVDQIRVSHLQPGVLKFLANITWWRDLFLPGGD